MCLGQDRSAHVRARQLLLEQSPLFHGLPDTVLDYVARHATERSLRDGQALFLKNDPSDFLALVLRGRVYKILYGPDGQELIVDTIEAGETVDETALLDSQNRNFTAIAYGPARVLLLARRHFPALTSEPAVLERAHATLCLRLRKAVDSLETMCLHRLESRLARYLLSVMPDDGRGGGFEVALPPTQSILAAMVNASRPKLNAQLQTWHRSGLVSRRRNILRINDIDQFRCKAYLGRDFVRTEVRPRQKAN
ncbi:Crp/Fnr family transcriptional regulator [Lysobacter silvisoli]|uniref:CRP-like protein Clp n=1 Tax=Lysobacter silvisoli TaxID=2293254 RepID=A0A371JXB1_9GAMM|nr:Crp/Fnr family transcriptional regulator [Lysobacter silvisoli]RDZ26295.1 Crp/Fnr family transcriptional regulator [Lysobacter silvisoli]